MKTNMGMLDRFIRAIIAIAIAALFFTEIITGTLGIVLLAIGAILLLTSLVGFCPLYAPFHFNSKKVQKT
ncbi:MAG: YgaP family membrane protein [Mariniphaga sp.]